MRTNRLSLATPLAKLSACETAEQIQYRKIISGLIGLVMEMPESAAMGRVREDLEKLQQGQNGSGKAS